MLRFVTHEIVVTASKYTYLKCYGKVLARFLYERAVYRNLYAMNMIPMTSVK